MLLLLLLLLLLLMLMLLMTVVRILGWGEDGHCTEKRSGDSLARLTHPYLGLAALVWQDER